MNFVRGWTEEATSLLREGLGVWALRSWIKRSAYSRNQEYIVGLISVDGRSGNKAHCADQNFQDAFVSIVR